jgi:hypothetical protein
LIPFNDVSFKIKDPPFSTVIPVKFPELAVVDPIGVF